MVSQISSSVWSCVTNQQDDETDFTLIISDGSCFSVHKQILAARSPVFAVLLSNEEEIEFIHLVVDCTICDMNQLIQFIYTGEVKGRVSHALMQLANYKIKTLDDICQSGFQDAFDLSMGKMAMIA